MDDKKIIINGNHNKYYVKKANREKLPEKRKVNYDDYILDYNNQVSVLYELYINDDSNNNYCSLMKSEIQKKINSYKNQDVKKDKYDESLFTSYENVLELIISQKVKCYYCKCSMYILYDKYREKRQWSLDRINNDIGHNKDNLVASCLECNLKRRNMNCDRFKKGKILKIIKE